MLLHVRRLTSSPQYPSFDALSPRPPDGRLDMSYINDLWAWRNAFFPWQIAIEFFLAVGLLMVIHPINCLHKIYSRTTPRLVLAVMTACFTIGVALNGFEFLENLGTEATGTQISHAVTSYRDRVSLEIAYNLGEALSIWIFSLDYVFLAIGFGCSAYLGFRYPLFSSWHAVVGSICALLCLASFALEVAQVAQSSVFTALEVVTMVLMGLAFPVWLVWLAWILGSDDFKLGNAAAAAVAAVPPTL